MPGRVAHRVTARIASTMHARHPLDCLGWWIGYFLDYILENLLGTLLDRFLDSPRPTRPLLDIPL